MQNKMSDLNNHLFMELERLNDEELEGDKLTEEISRARAITDVAEQVIANGALVLKAEQTRYNCAGKEFQMPALLGDGKE